MRNGRARARFEADQPDVTTVVAPALVLARASLRSTAMTGAPDASHSGSYGRACRVSALVMGCGMLSRVLPIALVGVGILGDLSRAAAAPESDATTSASPLRSPDADSPIALQREPGRFSAGVALTFAAPGQSAQKALLAAPELELRYSFTGGAALAARLGVAGLRLASDGGAVESTVAAGNPTLVATHPVHVPELHLGLGAAAGVLGLPSGVDDARLARNSLGLATNAHGLWSAWEWMPVRFAAFTLLELEPVRVGSYSIAVQAAAAWARRADDLVPAGESTRDDVYVQAAADLAIPYRTTRAGVRTQLVAFWTGSPDHLQAAAGPFVATVIGATELRVHGVIALDEPLASACPWAVEIAVSRPF